MRDKQTGSEVSSIPEILPLIFSWLALDLASNACQGLSRSRYSALESVYQNLRHAVFNRLKNASEERGVDSGKLVCRNEIRDLLRSRIGITL